VLTGSNLEVLVHRILIGGVRQGEGNNSLKSGVSDEILRRYVAREHVRPMKVEISAFR
jgi:hypothetical protein